MVVFGDMPIVNVIGMPFFENKGGYLVLIGFESRPMFELLVK